MASEERLERVVSEAQLRPGMLVELRNCNKGRRDRDQCGCTHRMVLIRQLEKLPFWTSKGTVLANAWDTAPAMCNGVLGPFLPIAEGRLFIVDVGDTREVSYSNSKELAD